MKKGLGTKLQEKLFISTARSEHDEMYLKAIWLAKEDGESPARISTLSRYLNISPPSVVQMLRKLEKKGYIEYLPRLGAKFNPTGEEVGRLMVRNTRIVETLMNKALGMKVDEGIACGLEHHMTSEFSDALCSLLIHPKTCPHGHEIPPGSCCGG